MKYSYKFKAYAKLIKKHLKNKDMTGRSMVEMLGVLAIIGVLSIGGISGYTVAMRRYKANEIIDLASKFATIALSTCQTRLEKQPEKYKTIQPNLSAVRESCFNAISAEDATLALPAELNSMSVVTAAVIANDDEIIVPVYIQFQNKNLKRSLPAHAYKSLCETIVSIAGLKYTTETSPYTNIASNCNTSTDRDYVILPIYVN